MATTEAKGGGQSSADEELNFAPQVGARAKKTENVSVPVDQHYSNTRPFGRHGIRAIGDAAS